MPYGRPSLEWKLQCYFSAQWVEVILLFSSDLSLTDSCHSSQGNSITQSGTFSLWGWLLALRICLHPATNRCSANDLLLLVCGSPQKGVCVKNLASFVTDFISFQWTWTKKKESWSRVLGKGQCWWPGFCNSRGVEPSIYQASNLKGGDRKAG